MRVLDIPPRHFLVDFKDSAWRLSPDSSAARWIAEIKSTLDGQIAEVLMTPPSFAEMVADFARELVRTVCPVGARTLEDPREQ